MVPRKQRLSSYGRRLFYLSRFRLKGSVSLEVSSLISHGKRGGTQSMADKITEVEARSLEALKEARTLSDLEDLRVRYLGKKGEITSLLKLVGTLPRDERPSFGARVNALREKFESQLEMRKGEIERQLLEEQVSKDTIDVTLPGLPVEVGGLHPLTKALREILDIFYGMGFTVYESREAETDEMNFVKLNIAQGHPARDMQDTLYLTDSTLLRTHTSPGQIRGMLAQEGKLPVRFVVPGRVYRRDATDASHHPVFHQIEGLAVDDGITMLDLKGVIMAFARKFFGPESKVRFRPSYFPFTEPSAEVDVSCVFCGGKGCSVCGNSGWLEVAGAGMVHPNVIRNGGYDPEKVTGFAFGAGLERLTMLKYGINDIRLFYENQKRFLQQFRGI